MKSLSRSLFFFFSLAIASSGCSGGSDPETRIVSQPDWTIDRPTIVQPTRKWTVLVYINSANDLETFGLQVVNQLEQIGSSQDVNVVVQLKRIKDQFDTSDGDWGGTRRYLISKDSDNDHIASATLANNSHADMGAPQTLQDFIKWGTQTFPAERYAVVLWSNGLGWRGISYDNQANSHIDTIQLPAALELGEGRKWDLITLDAPEMQMAEVAYELRNTGQFLAGPEQGIAAVGYPYAAILSELVAHPTQTGKELGITFGTKLLQGPSLGTSTVSLVDLSRVAPLALALDQLGSALTAAQTTQSSAIVAARDSAESSGNANLESRDLGDFLQLLNIQDSSVTAAIPQVQSVIGTAVVWSGSTKPGSRAQGLAAFLPSPSRFQAIDIDQSRGVGQRYSLLALSQAAPRWQHFLETGP